MFPCEILDTCVYYLNTPFTHLEYLHDVFHLLSIFFSFSFFMFITCFYGIYSVMKSMVLFGWVTKEEFLELDFGDDGGFHPEVIKRA